jgi:hypothetical protein
MDDWKYAQRHPSEALARLHFFSVKKKHLSGEMEARITVKEFVTAEIGALQFFATADIELNQKALAFKPVGWSDTLGGALTECLENLRRFEYQGAAEASS